MKNRQISGIVTDNGMNPRGQFLQALAAYNKALNYDAALAVIQKDAGILLASLSPEKVLAFLDVCPTEILKNRPLALLVLMRRMFTWHQIPKMLELKQLLTDTIAEDNTLSEDERKNLSGECDLIMSFLMYNDITGMGERSAPSGQFQNDQTCHQYPQNRKLDLRFSFCSDDVSPQIRNSGMQNWQL